MKWICRALAINLFLLMIAPAVAGPLTVSIAKQPGVGYLPLMLMEHEKLFEKHAKEAGIDITTQWLNFTGGSAMNDALLSGRLDIATGGIPPLLTIWSKTRNNIKVRGIASLSSEPQFLLTTNPKVKTIADFTSADKIALPAVKISNQAVMLQMAAVKIWTFPCQGRKALEIPLQEISLPRPAILSAIQVKELKCPGDFCIHHIIDSRPSNSAS